MNETRLLSDRQVQLMREYEYDATQTLAAIGKKWEVTSMNVHHIATRLIERGMLARNTSGPGYTPTSAWYAIRESELSGRS